MIHDTYMIHYMCNIATNITSRMIVAKKTINSNNRTSSLADPFPMTFEYLLLKKHPWCLPFRLHAPKLPYIPVKCDTTRWRHIISMLHPMSGFRYTNNQLYGSVTTLNHIFDRLWIMCPATKIETANFKHI